MSLLRFSPFAGIDSQESHINKLLRTPFDYCVPSASVDTRIIDCVDDINLDFVREYTAKIGYGKGPLEYLHGNKDFIVTRNG